MILFVCLDVGSKCEVGGTRGYWELLSVVSPHLYEAEGLVGISEILGDLWSKSFPPFPDSLSISLFYLCNFTLFDFYFRFLITHNKVEGLRGRAGVTGFGEYTQPGMLCSFHKCLLSDWEASSRDRDFVYPRSYHVHCFFLLFILLLRAF